MAGVENWLPSFDVGERHETNIALPPDQALTQALATAAAPDPFIRLLFRLRGHWLVVGPFSALIRRRWLRAAAARQRPVS